jgi:hypothetical protein
MRTLPARIAVACCLVACGAGWGAAQPPADAGARRTHPKVKAFAREELDRGELSVSEPSLSATSRSLLAFSFGEVPDVEPIELRLQLRVELLDRYPVFGKELIEPLLPRLEDRVVECMTLERRLTALTSRRDPGARPSEEEEDVLLRQGKVIESFDRLLEGLARAYADKHELLLRPRYALAPGTHYHIAGRVVARKDFDHKELKALVRRYFDNGPLDYQTPQVAIESREHGRFLREGRLAIEDLPSDPTLAAQFTVELLRRHPVLGERFLRPRLDAIESAIGRQLDSERDQADPRAEGRPEGPDYERLFYNLFVEYAAKNDLALVLPGGDQAMELQILRRGITVEAAANVKTITFVPGLVYRYAERSKQAISPLYQIVTRPGQQAALESGKYVYRLEFTDATRSDYRPVRIPADLAKDEPFTLRIPADPDDKGPAGRNRDDKRP